MISVSPSRLAVFFECPKKYDYIYNQELVSVEPQKGYFNKGNYFHELAHAYYQLIQSGVRPGSEMAVASIIRRIQNDIQRTGNPNLIPVYGIISKQIVRFIKNQSPQIDQHMEVLEVEAELTYPVNDEYELFGYADLIYRKQNSERIRDHKTGDKAQKKIDAQFSNQLLYYSTIWYLKTGIVPVAEINYINTKEYVKPKPDSDTFAFHLVAYSQRELEIYFEQICRVIEKMLQSEPLPAYGRQCAYCPYQVPCYMERKGGDPTPVLMTKFKKVSRGKRHESFTDEHTEGDGSD